MDTVTQTKDLTQEVPLVSPILDTAQSNLTSSSSENGESVVPDNVRQQADQWIDSILSIENKDVDKQHAANVEANHIGSNIESQLVEQSKLLQAPMSELMNDAENGSDVANGLLQLEQTARSIDPNGYDFSSVSGFRAFLAKLGFPTPMSSWIAKYQSTDAILKSIQEGLTQGKDKLKRDNMTLKDDQLRYRKTLYQLDDYIMFARYVDEKFAGKLESLTDNEKKRFLTDEVLFPIRQRHQDLITSKAVYQQAWVTSEFIIKTNEELVRGVDRALKHTLVSLGVASSLAIALARQKKVIVALESSKKVTEQMISDIADNLLTQGTQVMKQASEPFLQVEVMKRAFTKTLQAMDEVSKYRSDAIGKMKTGIDEMRTMTDEMDNNLNRIESGQKTREEFKVLLES